MTKIIPLLHGKQTIVDDEDFDNLSKYKWRCNSNGYVVRGSAARFRLHRVIMDAPVGMEVDHINGDTLDNRRENLRLCIHAENGRNRQLNMNNKSGYKGVSWNERDKKWRAMIKINLHHIYLGQFTDSMEAARAYDEAAQKYYGEFAKTNF